MKMSTVILVLCAVNALVMLPTLWLQTHADSDLAVPYQIKFAELKRLAGTIPHLGYVCDSDRKRRDGSDQLQVDMTGFRRFFTAQYVFAPTVLVYSDKEKMIVGNFDNYQHVCDVAQSSGDKVVFDGGNGAVLLQSRR